MLLSQWGLLGFAVWTMLLVVVGIGLPRVTAIHRREASPSSFNPAVPHGSERYQRCMRAHLNCVENLPIYASLVLLGTVLSVPGMLFQVAALMVLPARIGQSLSHISSGRSRVVVVRFYFYVVQLVGFALMAGLLVAHALR
jgi:uncharacterized MAPEG superfamily protein